MFPQNAISVSRWGCCQLMEVVAPFSTSSQVSTTFFKASKPGTFTHASPTLVKSASFLYNLEICQWHSFPLHN